MYDLKNHSIPEDYEQIGESGIIISDMSLGLYGNHGSEKMHKLYLKAFKKANPELDITPETFAVYNYDKRGIHQGFVHKVGFEEEVSSLEVTLVKGIIPKNL